ncbi:MAG: hypothetical protein Q4P24_02295 [Rhodobacterales bacterium]|nr:hypothetical protein [Rhodobacterales bacterium]
MANERRFNFRTGLALGTVGVTIAVKRVSGDLSPTWAAKGATSLSLIATIAVCQTAPRQAHQPHQRLTCRSAGPSGSRASTASRRS